MKQIITTQTQRRALRKTTADGNQVDIVPRLRAARDLRGATKPRSVQPPIVSKNTTRKSTFKITKLARQQKHKA